MREKPILFSAPMVRAILEGRKTQTRRAVNVSPRAVLNADGIKKGLTINPEFARRDYPVKGVPRIHIPFRHPADPPMPWGDCSCMTLYCPQGAPGDRLWVKETWQEIPDDGGTIVYRATDPDWETTDEWKWKPSIFMRREYSRIALEITGVRVERLQEIKAKDAIAEGIDTTTGLLGELMCWDYIRGKFASPVHFGPVDSYYTLWESINGKGSWALNPWVWVIEFKPLTPPQKAEKE